MGRSDIGSREEEGSFLKDAVTLTRVLVIRLQQSAAEHMTLSLKRNWRRQFFLFQKMQNNHSNLLHFRLSLIFTTKVFFFFRGPVDRPMTAREPQPDMSALSW